MKIQVLLLAFLFSQVSGFLNRFARIKTGEKQYAQDETVSARCNNDRLVVIVTVEYGTFDLNGCGDPDARERVMDLCQGKKECTFDVSDTFFTGSTCAIDVDEVLKIGYTCEKGQVFNQGDTFEAICTAENVVSIYFAVYGNVGSTCSDSGALQKVQDECNGKQSCSVVISDAFFSDSTCPNGVDETFQVEYECITNPCGTYYCANGGSCFLDQYANPECQCLGQWTGERCDADPCEGVSCSNNGQCCASSTGSTKCLCDKGFSGVNCEIPDDPCDPDFCSPNGQCINNAGVPQCQCNQGFSGEFCKIPDNPCDTSPCQPTGQCVVNSAGNAECLCDLGYKGADCSQQVTGCDLEPCENGGQCIEGGLPSCDCTMTQYFGNTCERTCSVIKPPTLFTAQDDRNGNSYLFEKSSLNSGSWSDANIACANFGSNVAPLFNYPDNSVYLWEPNDEVEINLVLNQLVTEVAASDTDSIGYFIAPTDHITENSPIFTFGNLDPFTATNELDVSTNSDDHDCIVAIVRNGVAKLEYASCASDLQFICEIQDPCPYRYPIMK